MAIWPLALTCPTCDAEPKQPCVKWDPVTQTSLPYDPPHIHQTRIDLAAEKSWQPDEDECC